MILAVAPEPDILMMDETDYSESMLLRSLDDEHTTEDQKSTNLGDSSHSTTFSESTASLVEEDDLEKEELTVVTPIKKEIRDVSPTEESPCQSSIDESQETQDEQVKPNQIASNSSVNSSPSQIAVKMEQDNIDPIDKGIPGKFDVLCGQSRICANHTGNRRFQVVLDLYAPRYDAATSKQEKMTLTKEIVGCITHSGGRFLKYKDGLWQEISTVTARDKVSHALRTKVASWRRQQQQQQQQQQAQGENLSPSSKGKPSPRRRGAHRRRRSSGTSVATSASDIVTTSFDGNDPASTALVEDLLKTQREIFATLQQSSEVSSPSKRKEKHPLKR